VTSASDGFPQTTGDFFMTICALIALAYFGWKLTCFIDKKTMKNEERINKIAENFEEKITRLVVPILAHRLVFLIALVSALFYALRPLITSINGFSINLHLVIAIILLAVHVICLNVTENKMWDYIISLEGEEE